MYIETPNLSRHDLAKWLLDGYSCFHQLIDGVYSLLLLWSSYFLNFFPEPNSCSKIIFAMSLDLNNKSCSKDYI